MRKQDTSPFSDQFPLIITVALLLSSYIPSSIIIPQNIRPLLALASTFFWLTHRPDLFGLLAVSIISIIADTITSSPFGSNLLMFFALYTLVNRFEKFFYNKTFLTYWYGFILISFAAIFLKWLILSIYYAQMLPLTPVFFTYLTTIFTYPLVSIFNAIIQTYMRQADE